MFLSTEARRTLLLGLPVVPVPIIYEGTLSSAEDLQRLVGPSRLKSPGWREALLRAADASGSRTELVERQTEDSNLVEGLYVRHESDGFVRERCKFVRGDFQQAIAAADGHWLDRPILPNGLAPGVDIFASEIGAAGAYDDPSAM